jgi:hypothetical protein
MMLKSALGWCNDEAVTSNDKYEDDGVSDSEFENQTSDALFDEEADMHYYNGEDLDESEDRSLPSVQ